CLAKNNKSYARGKATKKRRSLPAARTPSACATPNPQWTGPPPRASNDVAEKYLGPKIPKVRGFAVALLAKASQTIPFSQEITMAKVNLSGMTFEERRDLRKGVDEMLLEHRAEIEKRLERMAVVGGQRVVRGGGSILKGRKVPPKYRGPSGETWAGRGARPRWLVAAIKGRKKLDDFLIDHSERKGR